MASEPIRVNAWSGPRSLSTALMYSFNSRSDTYGRYEDALARRRRRRRLDTRSTPAQRGVLPARKPTRGKITPPGPISPRRSTGVDEPLYAHHLSTCPDIERPYRDELLASMNPDGAAVVSDVLMGSAPTPIMYYKHMAKQTINLDMAWAADPSCRHVVLIRDPVKLAASFAAKEDEKVHSETSLDELGVVSLVQVFSKLRTVAAAAGLPPPIVLDSDDLTRDPEGTLKTLCAALGIPADDAAMASMMAWPEGPKDCDGVWASYWYESVHKSSGWNLAAEKPAGESSFKTLPKSLFALVEEAMPFYEMLKRHAVKPEGFESKLPVWTMGLEGDLARPCTILAKDCEAVVAKMPSPLNTSLMTWVGPPGGGRVVPRHLARVSVFDSAVQVRACIVAMRFHSPHCRTYSSDDHCNNGTQRNPTEPNGTQRNPTTNEILHCV